MGEQDGIVRQNFYLYQEHWTFLREYAHYNHKSMSQVVRDLIDYLADHESILNNYGGTQ